MIKPQKSNGHITCNICKQLIEYGDKYTRQYKYNWIYKHLNTEKCKKGYVKSNETNKPNYLTYRKK